MTNNLIDIENYLETMCGRHIELRHDLTAGRKAFYRVTGDESSALSTNAQKNSVHVDDYNGRYTGAAELLSKPVSIYLKILVKAAGVSEREREDAYNLAEEIMDDIVARLAYDSAAMADCFPLYGIDFTSMPFNRIGPEGQYGYGYRIAIPIRSKDPVYDKQKWSDKKI